MTFTCLYEYCRDRRLLYGGCLIYLSVMIFVPGFLLLLPLIFYDLAGSKAERKEIYGLLLFLPAVLAVLIIHVLTGRTDVSAALFVLFITGVPVTWRFEQSGCCGFWKIIKSNVTAAANWSCG